MIVSVDPLSTLRTEQPSPIELGHWIGAKQRLNRDFPERHADETNSKEELIAEMISAFLCAEMKIDNLPPEWDSNNLAENQAAYLKGWIKVLKGDSKLIITAASAAQKAFKFITSNYQKEENATQKNSNILVTT